MAENIESITSDEVLKTEDQPTKSKREMCSQCERPKKVCWCSWLPNPRIDLGIKIVIIQHPSEAKRAIRTAKMLELGLSPGVCRVHRVRKVPGNSAELQALLADTAGVYLLFPGPKALELNENGLVCSPDDEETVETLVILDGTWDEAKKLYMRSPELQKLKQIKLNIQKKSEYVVRTQPSDGCLSTLESGVYAAALLTGDNDIVAPLLEPLRALCNIQLNHGAVLHDSHQSKRDQGNNGKGD